MPTQDEDTFRPTDATCEKLRAMEELHDKTMAEFFSLWESEGDPKQAGSIVAHRYMIQASRIAVFGAVCAGDEPKLERWLAVCEERFEEAVASVVKAFETAPDEAGRTENEQPDNSGTEKTICQPD